MSAAPSVHAVAASAARRAGPGRGPTAARVLRSGAVLAFGAAALAFTLGVVNQSLATVSLAGLFAGLAFIGQDVARIRRGGLSPATFYALGFAATSLGNVAAFMNEDGPRRATYFLYSVESQLMLATMLSLAGGVIPILAFRAVLREPAIRMWADMLPTVIGRVRDRQLVFGAVALTLLSFASRLVPAPAALGTVSFFYLQIPLFATFVLARAGAQRRVPYAMPAALVIALLEAARAVLQSYLRIEIVAPLFAFATGALIGARSTRPLRSIWFIPIYVAGAAFIIGFGAFGEARTQTSGGVERISAVYARTEPAPEAAPASQQTLLSRLTSFNQLSQVGRVVEEDGFLGGETLEYLAYAFVPRALWPEKPLIAKGSWFAVRIGLAYRRADGRYSNSVNMTIPGELYLNFGWFGVVAGCSIFGGLLAALWTRTRFWTDPTNVPGGAFGFYLLSLGVGLGADLQIIVTVIAMYLIFLAVGAGLRTVAGVRERAPGKTGPLRRHAA
ncbi:MAG: hypothetical protein WKG32_07925 [Gemmatimonadaceae bacterium]